MKELIYSEEMTVILKILAIVMVTILINTVIEIIMKKTMKVNDAKKGKYKAARTSFKMVRRLKSVILIVFCTIASLFQIPNFSSISWSLLSGAGIISLILGYAAQKTLSNFFCGIGIVFSDPFEIGDFVRVVEMDMSGYVEDVTLRHTVIRTIDNRRVIIPNSKMDELSIENYNHTDNEVCLLTDYSISYSSDIDKAVKIFNEELGKLYNPNTNGINKNVEFPKVRVYKWADSSIILRGWIWGADSDSAKENVYALNKILKSRFDKEGIEIPFNYINVVDRTEPKKGKRQ